MLHGGAAVASGNTGGVTSAVPCVAPEVKLNFVAAATPAVVFVGPSIGGSADSTKLRAIQQQLSNRRQQLLALIREVEREEQCLRLNMME